MLTNKKLIMIVIVSFLIALVGCDGEENNENNPDENLPPDSLLEVSAINEGIIEELEGIYNQIEERREEEELKLERMEQSREVDLNKLNNEQENEENNQLPQEEEELVEEIEEGWDELESEVEALHQSWNEYESEVNLKPEQVERIETRLNQMTEEVADKLFLVALVSATQFDLEVAKLYGRYDLEGEAEIKEAKASTRKIIFLNRLQIEEQKLREEQHIELERLKDLYFEIDQSLEGEEENKELKKLEEAIEDLETAIKMSEDDEVIEVKGELILTRLEELEG
ncbi:hypothetical protein [Natroniella sp. ANB-PHB2]|uniref:hypothetical protein n=1 Tax=Natroniella sp. ANB-PHB2 TaxID=3384444 RepID=UPI0038D4F747